MQCENRTAATDALNQQCLYPSCNFAHGPCKSATERQYAKGKCDGTTIFATPSPAPVDRTMIHRALSATVEAMLKMCSVNITDDDRLDIRITTLINIREKYIGNLRLTSMARVCDVCGKYLGTKEGDGATGQCGAWCSECASAAIGSRVRNPAEIDDGIEDMEAKAFRKVYDAICAPYDETKSMTAGIINALASFDDQKDAAAIENAALI